MYNKKRGQSEIITTVLIILLVLAAIVIVWQVVKTTVNSGSTQVTAQSGCIGLSLDITGVTNVGVTPGINITVVKVKRGSDNLATAAAPAAGLNSLKIIVEDSTGAQKCNLDIAAANLPVTLQELSISIPVGNCIGLSTGTYKVKIAPKISGQQCDVAASKDVTV